MIWQKKGFYDFSLGTLGNGGQNLYVSAKGVLQRIFNYDVNGDGYPDLFFANSQSMGERPPLYLYNAPLSSEKFTEIPSGGSYEGVMVDLNGDGFDDLVVACQNNGTHSDITAMVYYGSAEGLSEKYKSELPAPDSTGVAAGDFNGDGRMDLAFICGDFLRVFYQNEYGIVPFEYTDIALNAVSLSASDMDGDGYCDLYVKRADGVPGILWGGAEGLFADTATWIGSNLEIEKTRASSTPGRRAAYREWRTAIVCIEGQKYLFRTVGDNIVFDRCRSDRKIEQGFTLVCPGAIGVSAGDLDGDKRDDLAVAVCTNKNLTEKSMVFWGGENGFCEEKSTCFDTVSAQSMLVTDLLGKGRNVLVVCQGGTSVLHSTESFILKFNADRRPVSAATFQSGDAMRIVAGRTGSRKEKQLVVINHETGRVRGDENVYIYLGGPDGYIPERRIELPGWAAVDGAMFDYNDDGYVDVLVSNCSENAPHMDPGSFLYIGGPDGIRKERRAVLPSIRGHGAAVGDFRRCGYLDIAMGGYRNRELRIFHGGSDGYDLKDPDKIVFGPDPLGYVPPVPEREEDIASVLGNKSENALYEQFGEIRWLFSADFNKDGWPDLFVSQITGPYCYILWGGPEGFSTSRMTKLATDGVASANAADLDGDGYLDLVLGGHMSKGKKSMYESYITIYWGGPDGYREHRKTQLPASCANSVAIGDFNGDGILDIYATAYNSGRCRDIVSYLYYGGKGGVYSVNNHRLLFNHSGSGCVAGDFNGDGYADLAVACHKGYGNHNSESFVFWGGPDGLNDERKTVLPTVGPHGMSTVEPGNIMDRSDNEYYYSESFKIPERQKVKTAAWEAFIPVSTWVRMQMRHAKTPEALLKEKWQGAGDRPFIENGEDLTALRFTGGYLQYRLILGARCACGTPRVTSVTVEFSDE